MIYLFYNCDNYLKKNRFYGIFKQSNISFDACFSLHYSKTTLVERLFFNVLIGDTCYSQPDSYPYLIRFNIPQLNTQKPAMIHVSVALRMLLKKWHSRRFNRNLIFHKCPIHFPNLVKDISLFSNYITLIHV